MKSSHVKEIKILYRDEEEVQTLHIIFTPSGNIFRCPDESRFLIDIDEEQSIFCDSFEDASLIYNLPMADLYILMNILERARDGNGPAAEINIAIDPIGNNLVSFNEGSII